MNYCDQCFRDATLYGEFCESIELIKWGNNYSLVDGHDEIFRFPEPPIHEDPLPGIDQEKELDVLLQNKEICAADEAFFKAVGVLRKEFHFHPQVGHELVEKCKKRGWSPEKDGWLEYWVMNRAAIMIKEYERTA